MTGFPFELVHPMIAKHAKWFKHATVVGSVRRHVPMVSDLDLMTHSVADMNEAKNHFARHPERLVFGCGSHYRFFDGFHDLQIDLTWVDHTHWGPSMLFYTGSSNFYSHLQRQAVERGYILDVTGLHHGHDRIDDNTEEDIMTILGLKAYLDPRLRSW